jgi:RecA/RadA recombinase
MTARRPLDPPAFTSALQVYANRAEVSRLSTGSHRLDQLLGGIEATRFYLFYGADGEKVPDKLLYRLMVETIKTGGHVAYMLCGNYRRDRTTLDTELLLSLIEATGLEVEEALSRIHIIGVFSEAQLMNAPSLVEEVMTGNDVRLLAVQQISKLFYSETAIGIEDRNEFTGVVSRLKELCTVYEAALVASCMAKRRRNLSPEPMGGSFLRHAVNVMVYLRAMQGGEVSAQLVKHFDKHRTGRRVSLGGKEENVLGRITKDSMRGRLQEQMRHLRSGYRDALKDNDMQTAFDTVWTDWNHEQGAMIYAQVVSALDLLNLTGVLANRREIEKLRDRLEALEKRDEG